MTPGEEEAKRRFMKDAIPAFIELLGMAEEALKGWRKRQGKEGPEWEEEVDVKDLMIAANTMIVMANAVAIRETMANQAQKAPPALDKGELVRLDSEKVHQAFAAQLRLRRVDLEAASRVLAELVSTDAGFDMISVMMADALNLKAGRGMPRSGGGEPGRLDELEGPHGEG